MLNSDSCTMTSLLTLRRWPSIPVVCSFFSLRGVFGTAKASSQSESRSLRWSERRELNSQANRESPRVWRISATVATPGTSYSPDFSPDPNPRYLVVRLLYLSSSSSCYCHPTAYLIPFPTPARRLPIFFPLPAHDSPNVIPSFPPLLGLSVSIREPPSSARRPIPPAHRSACVSLHASHLPPSVRGPPPFDDPALPGRRPPPQRHEPRPLQAIHHHRSPYPLLHHSLLAAFILSGDGAVP